MRHVTKDIKLIILLILAPIVVEAQTDTLIFNNGEIVVGEVQQLSRGVITVETAYSDSDFKIEWDKVKVLRSTQEFMLRLSDGRRISSVITIGEGGKISISDGIFPLEIDLMDIVELRPVKETFADRFSASVDVGFNLTKANNLMQFNSRLNLGYLTKRWELTGSFSNVFSRQDSIVDTRRTDGDIGYTYFFAKKWFVGISNIFLQNDEQKLALRSTTKLGIGNYLIINNALYLSVFTGAAFNSETFTEDTSPARQTGEAFLGLEYNMFDAGDLSIKTNFITYHNLTDQGRVRADFKFDIKYDLPLDFYIKAGTTVNYDNRPIAGASELDYVLQTGVGWEW